MCGCVCVCAAGCALLLLLLFLLVLLLLADSVWLLLKTSHALRTDLKTD